MSESQPYPDRRHDDQLIRWRLEKTEQEQQKINDKIDEVSDDVKELNESLNRQFTELKQTLFERPVFVTFELLKVELESRDRAFNEYKRTIETETNNSVSAKRHYVVVSVSVLIAIFGPLIVEYLRRK